MRDPEDRRGGRGGRRGGCNLGCGGGCGGVLLVLTVGIILSLFGATVGIGLSVRVPFTASNITLAGSIGAKAKVAGALPDYAAGRLGGNQNFVNGSQTLTIGPAEGATLLVIGNQGSAPAFDLHLVAH